MSELCTYLGINTSTMANWKTRQTDPPAKYIAPICDFLDISTEYLLTGKEKNSPTEKLSADEEELLTYYKKLSDKEQGKLLGRAEALVELDNKNKSPKPGINYKNNTCDTSMIYIDYYDLPVSAGTGIYLDNSKHNMIKVEENSLTNEANFALRVKGDSMEPKFYDGDVILIKSQPCVEFGEIGIFIINCEGYVKEYQGNRLVSLNSRYDDIIIGEYDDVYCKGKVIGKL